MADIYLYPVDAGSNIVLRDPAGIPTAAPDTTAPTFIGALTATVATSSITVDWSGATSADNVAVARREYRIGAGTYTAASSAEEAAKAHTFTGLAAATEFVIDVRCVDTSGNASAPLSITFATLAAPPVDPDPDPDPELPPGPFIAQARMIPLNRFKIRSIK